MVLATRPKCGWNSLQKKKPVYASPFMCIEYHFGHYQYWQKNIARQHNKIMLAHVATHILVIGADNIFIAGFSSSAFSLIGKQMKNHAKIVTLLFSYLSMISECDVVTEILPEKKTANKKQQ